MRLFLHLIVSTLAVLIAAYVVPGVAVDSVFTAFVVAVALGIVNLFVRPALVLLTFPITVLTLGVFALVLNTLLIMLVAAAVPGFHVASFWAAFLFGIALFFVTAFFHFFSLE